MRMTYRCFVLSLAVLGLAGCARNPVTGAREFVMMTEAQEIALGRESDEQVRNQMGLYDDEELQQYVSEIGLQMAARSHRPDLPWSFAVVDSPAVNAFAIPGGYIYPTRGIMAFLGDEADLAGVLGHEVGHVTARHSVQAYTRASGAQLGLAVGTSGRRGGTVRTGRVVSPIWSRRGIAGRASRCPVRRRDRMGSHRSARHALDLVSAQRRRGQPWRSRVAFDPPGGIRSSRTRGAGHRGTCHPVGFR